MTSKELKRLSRGELLEILIEQMEENDRLKAQVREMGQRLADRQIVLKEAGSIAEAALRLNEVFEAAQNAAQQYLDSIQGMCAKQNHPKTDGIRKASDGQQVRQKAAQKDSDDYWAALISEAKSLAGTPEKK